MIQSFSNKYKKPIAAPLLLIMYLQTIILPLHAAIGTGADKYKNYSFPKLSGYNYRYNKNEHSGDNIIAKKAAVITLPKSGKNMLFSPEKATIGGPSSPEASSFKAVGSDNLVNLFTGDFSYSIPLLDVGGYPVNLFYTGGISMEQEASWVGLGWNINPGSVSRNMRGVPDDFNGNDTLIQTQNVKPNRTWGGEVGIDGEVLGWKTPKLNFSLGYSYNNYLGPAIDIGAGVALNIPITQSVKYDKEAAPGDTIQGLSAQVGVNAKLSSRSGLTFSPSLNANLHLVDKHSDFGIGLSTSYNSRTGIKEININSQMSIYRCQNNSKGEFLNTATVNKDLMGSSISFARPSYMPALRMPMQYSNYSGQIEFGVGMFGLRGASQLQGYYSESKVPAESQVVYKPLVGFMYSEKAIGNKNAVMDFTRLNDGEVTPNTPIISAPQYAYDIFSIQGEGTGGVIRAYRGDLGFVRDNETTSKDANFSLGADLAPPGHYGGNWNIILTPTKAGGWEDDNNTLRQTMAFQNKADGIGFENVYFRNPGEATVTNPELLNRTGGDNLVRFKLTGSNVNPRLESILEQFNKKTLAIKTDFPLNSNTKLAKRDKRTQVTTFLTANEASSIGLDKWLKSYTGDFDANNNIVYDSIARTATGSFRKSHHISEINVLEASGMRYVYGLPVYSIRQKDYTFSVDNIGDVNTGIVSFNSSESTVSSPHVTNNKDKLDGYVMAQETPAYASSFLLSGLLSPDYVDVTGNGITEDDLGNAVKFNYNRSADIHKWRTPRNNTTAATAHFNEGLKSEKKDNKATISYGEREVWYLNSIESKSMIAIFKTGSRDDAKGVRGELDGRANAGENANKRLDQIDLYTKAEIKAKGITNARPIKTVHFKYSYSLCHGTPDNASGGGKLTLDSIYFTYNGQARVKKDKYVFNYGNTASAADNPVYAYNASDKWGTYKNPDTNPATNVAANPGGLTNADFPYTSTNKSKNDEYAGAWSLKKILLPSGGQMEVQYEADDYGYVQNRRACDMFSIYGMGTSLTAVTDNGLYRNGLPASDNYYVYVKLPHALQNTDPVKQKQEILDKYLQGIDQLAFKLLINMPKGPEPLTVYANYDDYGLCSNSTGKDIIFIKLRAVDGKSPLSKSAIGFITENLPGQAFEGYDVEVDGVAAFLEMAGAMLTNIKNAFKNVDNQMRSASPPKARTIILDKSFVRLDDPYKMKYGGGVRVKRVLIKDNWNKMTGQFNSTYGQDYDYTTTEKINGVETTISSGVASYEPGIGSEENPFREVLAFSNKMPLASAQYGAIEMPMLEGLYPSANVGYSKVTIRSIHRKGTHGDSALRSAIGKQVTEFYTAKDYPTYSAYTPLKSTDYHRNTFFNILYKDITDRKVVSQGFLVETNDMHGKIKSQAAYSESDEKTPLSYSLHTYKNTGQNGFDDKVDFVSNEQGGAVTSGNMGIDVELMTDVREFKVQSNGFSGQAQCDFYNFVPIVIFSVTMIPLKTYTENKYRAVTCTKLINYHAIEDSVIVMDKGSVISTKTIAYDAETGSPLVTKTRNEFNDPVYNTVYPAYWAYSGMGPACKNVGAVYTGVNFYDGKITNISNQGSIFESGDELYITNAGSGSSGCITPSAPVAKLWAFDKTKDTSSLTTTVPDIYFMDSAGNFYTRSNVSIRIVRSGKRNLLPNNAATIASMKSPIINNILVIDADSKVINAAAVEFKEKWQTDEGIFNRHIQTTNTSTCTTTEAIDCNGYLDKNMNPYLKGLLGTFRNYQSKVFYGSRKELNTTTPTSLRTNGYLDDFKLYWDFNIAHNLVPDVAGTKWVWNEQVTKYNTKGLELETKNALNIYTAAQYGFNKTVAVALANNSRYNEMFAESFEDNSYNESLHNVQDDGCLRRHIDFTGLANSSIISTEGLNFNAHSGKKIMKVNSSSTVAKTIKLVSGVDDNYNFQFTRSNIITETVTPTGNYQKISSIPASANMLNTFTFSNLGLVTQIAKNPISPIFLQYDAGSNTSRFFSYYKSTQNIKIPTTGTYTFTLTASQNFEYEWSGGDVATFNRAAVDLNIKNSDGSLLFDRSLYSDNAPSATYSVHLNCGYYVIETYTSGDIVVTGNHNSLRSFASNAGYTSNISGITGFYVSCTKNNPIPADSTMLNPVFSLPPNKKMFFSAWVHEDCSVPCAKPDFDKSNVEIWSGGSIVSSANIKRTGIIIEGWQKIEGEFTVPSGDTTAIIKFVNSAAAPMYVDDIRVHPFNANMKSYVYDARTLRLGAELDENNYASFYEYDEEGQLVRVKKETAQGIKTINETRATKQQSITEVQ